MRWIQNFLDGVDTVAVICTQWGDSGKGKLVDIFASWADIIARGTGGENAGHTIRVGGKKYVFHLLPSGILHPGKLNVIGSGVAVNPATILKELGVLREAGIPFGNLAISMDAHLVLPQHILLDRMREREAGRGKIGTTGRGMGPVYEDRVARIGLVVNDLLNPDLLARKLSRNLESKGRLLHTYDWETAREVLHEDVLGGGKFYNALTLLNFDAILEQYLQYGREIAPYIDDTDSIIRRSLKKKKILCEGAQGNMLSVKYGTYPYVTSSDCSVEGLAEGVGLERKDIDLVLGIMKAFYMTRVGGGPFPTEFGGIRSAEYCSTASREAEAAEEISLNSEDEFRLGIALRRKGDEYGATTGRPRRTGWDDLPLLRYSMSFTGPNLVLTKVDVMDGVDVIRICTHYIYDGPPYTKGSRVISPGDRIDVAVPDAEVMARCIPQYAEFPGWKESISEIRRYEDLPVELRIISEFIEEQAGVRVVIISVGPDREETILVKRPV